MTDPSFNPKGFSVFGYVAPGKAATFAAYTPTLDAAREDLAQYREWRPELTVWQIVDETTGETVP
jgi:hypothetical protein